jgi:DNA polymerase-3 subunit gamma/tau
MLTGEAFNALLKTLEEPPQHTIFIMATTESHKLPKTIISRCQRFDFKRISSTDIAEKLQKEIEAEEINIQKEAVKIISESCDGAMRDAESILDQLSVLSDKENPITEANVFSLLGKSSAKNLYEIIQNLFFGDYLSLIDSLERLTQTGTDILLYTQDLLSYCRDIIIMAETDGKSSFFSIIPKNDNEIFFEQAKKIQIGYLIKLTVMLSNVLPSMKFLTRPQLLLETTLLQLRYLVDHPVSKQRKRPNNPHSNTKKDSVNTKPENISQTSKTLNRIQNPSSKQNQSSKKKEPPQAKKEGKTCTIKEKQPDITDPLWKKFVLNVKTKSPDLFIHIMRTQLVKVDQETAYVVFSIDNKFSFEQFNKQKNIKNLNTIFHEECPEVSFNLVPNLGYNKEKVSYELRKKEEKEQIINDPVIIETLKTFRTTVEKVEKTNKEKI